VPGLLLNAAARRLPSGLNRTADTRDGCSNACSKIMSSVRLISVLYTIDHFGLSTRGCEITAVLCTHSVDGAGGGKKESPIDVDGAGGSKLTVINGEWERLGGIDEAGREGVS
jgi:hypothetical protein